MDFMLIILSSLLFTIPLYQPNLFFISWFAFIPLIYLSRDYDYSHSFIIAVLVGFLNSLLSFYWLYRPLNQALKMPFSFNIFVLLLYFLISALPLGLWILINKFLQPDYSYSPFIAALSWTLLEFLRFKYLNFNPLNYFAYTQSSFFSIVRYASYGGIFLVSFISVLIASYFVKIALNFSWKKIIPLLFIFFILIIIPFFTENNAKQKLSEIEVSVLNFNVESAEDHFEKLENEIETLADLINQNESNYIFTPEKIISFDLLKNAYYRQKLYSKISGKFDGKHLQLGSYAADKEYNSQSYNSLFLLNSDFKILNRYNKKINFFNGVNLNFKNKLFYYINQFVNFNYYPTAKNRDIDIIKIDKLSYINLISDEIFIPLGSRNYTNDEESNLIINSALEKEFSAKVYNNFSLSAAVFQAAETGNSVLRAVNGGYSAYIDYQGNIIWKGSLEAESRSFLVKLQNKNTYYQKNPNKIIFILIFILILIILIKVIIILKNKLSSRD